MPVLELDEMWHYLQKKATSSGYGLLYEEEEGELLIFH